MRVLCFVDTHGSDSHIRKIIEQSHYADVLVCAGDFTVFENGMSDILRRLNSIGKPVMLIHGNHESASSVMASASGFKNIKFIHKNHFLFGDFAFFGYGGGGFSSQEDKFEIVADSFIKELKNLEKKTNRSYNIVLVTHAPPYATKLDDMGEHVGVKNFTQFILKHKPVLAVSGHLHENSGAEDKMNLTLLINPGPNGRIIEI